MRNHKLIRIFVGHPLSENGSINLCKEHSHYLTNVMRLKVSDSILIFNGSDGEFNGVITSASKNEVSVNIKNKTRAQVSSPDLTLLYAPVKNAKNEFIVQKATEMGVSHIQPVITKNTIKDKAKNERLRLVAIEAAEQCERLDVPEVNEIAELDKILHKYENHKIMLCDETGAGKAVAEAFKGIKPGDKWAILIGPEGGFSDAEIKMLHEMKNVYPVGLGPRILRAETAIITALALWQNYMGDFGSAPDFRG
jgi:16S rRNA (uracil1498-N3)-methyltransferase